MSPSAPTRSAQQTLRYRLTGGLSQTPSAFVVLGGLWLTLTPLVTGNSQSYPWWNDTATGLIIATLAVIRVLRPARTWRLSLVNVALGGWMIAAPFVLGFAGLLGVAWNDMIVGVLVMMLAGTSAVADVGQAPTRS